MTGWNMCSSAAAIEKAGVNANSDIIASGSTLQRWSEQVEGAINSETRKDWVGSPATTNFLGALSDTSSDLIARKIVAYDMSGYSGLAYAQTTMDQLRDNATRNIRFLREIDIQEKME